MDRTGQSAWFSTNLISEYWIIHKKVLWLLACKERKGFINISTNSISASCLSSSRAFLLSVWGQGYTSSSWRLLFTRTSGMQISTSTFSFSLSVCKLWVLVFKFLGLALISLMRWCLYVSHLAVFGSALLNSLAILLIYWESRAELSITGDEAASPEHCLHFQIPICWHKLFLIQQVQVHRNEHLAQLAVLLPVLSLVR